MGQDNLETTKRRVSQKKEDSESEDLPMAKRVKSNGKKNISSDSDSSSHEPLKKRIAKKKIVDKETEEDSSNDKPLAKRKKVQKKKKKNSTDSNDEEIENDDSYGSDSFGSDEPLNKKRTKRISKTTVKKIVKMNEDTSENTSLKRQRNSVKKKTETVVTKINMEKKKSTSKIENGLKSKEDVVGDADELGEGEEESEEYKWWLESVDDSVKWQTLEHSGPLFPPPYEPHGVKMKYDGVEVELKKDSEEVATFFAAILQTDYVKDKTFRENFFKDFKKILKKDKNNIIKEYEKCDFTPIYDYLQVEKEKKKLLTKEDKKKIKDEKASIDLKYGWCLLNGRKEKVGNYRIEPPGLFRGRGMHPLTGTLKLRVQPEQVTINIGEEAVIPTPPDGHKWGKVQHDPKVSWLATWKDNVNDNIKYIFLAANSSLKGQSDLKKFEKARELKKHIHRIRTSYTAELTDQVTAIRQRATAMYLIDKLALRAGNEKGEDEADTVGCCSLRYEHITLEPPNTVIFDFLGKDSIRYYNEVQVDAQVFKNLKIFKKEPKKEGDQLFDRLTTGQLNKHLSSQMAGLTGKVFRTFNASFTFQQELLKTPTNGTVQEKILAYNRANRQVAVLCNHQRSIPKGHGNQMSKINEKISVFKLELKLVKELILKLLPKAKKSRPELLEEISDFEEEEVSRVKKEYKLFEMEKFRKKLEKKNEDKKNEKIKEETSFATKETKSEVRKSKKALSEDEVESGKKKKELDDWVILTEKEIENECKEFEKTAGYPSMKEKLEKMTLERLENRLKILVEKLRSQNMQLVDKEEGKTTALGTSKINYIDPRISAAWCHKNDVPIDKIFNATLKLKFRWALDVAKDWEF